MINIEIKNKVLSKNDEIAEHIRTLFRKKGITGLNLIGSPGSGKTALLEATFKHLNGKLACAVVEGDVKTENDKIRIEATGVPAVQIETESSCHLNAEQVEKSLSELDLDNTKCLFIENVGNLICTTSYDLGEKYKVIVISVAEGQDKPLKYPSAFTSTNVLVITKTDLAPYVDVDIEKLKENALSINPKLRTFITSAKTGDGIEEFANFLMDVSQ
ncbi:MAG: hydrogenase nickel incorporation protein HypB [bacterium]|nr:hydrogenase nickel incorporation protein HypB [bacterium]MBU1917470.1 hydrogenase nickel incorporation protein HypB [bacterium]